jgi:phosphoserine aminotransferase
MSRVYNFSAGPSMLPEEVLQQAAQELPDWQKTGMSVMEMSHRGKQFLSIAEALEADLRELMAIPDNYKVLFLQGGASAQFSMLPLNLLGDKSKACYVNTGAWSTKAIKDAQRYCNVVVSASGEISRFTEIPAQQSWAVDPDAAYLHYTINETIHGVEFFDVPDAHGLTLVTDMSSNILSRPIDVNRFGVIYAGSQKNMGPAGVTVVIVRDDLLGKAAKQTPDIFNYAEQAKNDSMINTPPTHSWYMVGLVLQWLKRQGGLQAIEQRNIAKSQKLYKAIDDSSLFHNPVKVDCRSRMNVPFILADAELDKPFLKLAEENGLTTLAGHRSVGGMRASIYNAMPEAGVDALIEFMAEFERTH